MKLTLGLKYCGSCNVQFDRTKLIQLIKDQFGDLLEIGYTSTTSKEYYFDLILVLNACPVACANINNLKPKKSIFVVQSKDDVCHNGNVINWIRHELEKV